MSVLGDMGILHGVEVTVHRKVVTGEDEMGEPIERDVPETVANVLFSPGGTSRLAELMRAAGSEVDAEFHFPKTYADELAGCSIEHGGHVYEVVGNPQRYMDGLTPGPWDLQVEGRCIDG